MANKMLIDASHPEETRVVVLRGNRVEEFDFESASKKQLRGNIYLAKVMRVEPSLQAAFVDYGGNRHGFLAFSEVHPDYYQIPVADRQALIDEEARAQRDEEEDVSRAERRSRRYRRGERNGQRAEKRRSTDSTLSEAYADKIIAHTEGSVQPETDAENAGPRKSEEEQAASSGSLAAPEASATESQDTMARDSAGRESTMEGRANEEHLGDPAGETAIGFAPDEFRPDAEPECEETAVATEGAQVTNASWAATEGSDTLTDEGDGETEEIEQLGGDAMEEMPIRPQRPRRQYKIQEVIKRRQVLLAQVVKEERGNKGAALTTYLSLAGRYSVLMPNTARGGGISRKITDPADRRRLKSIAQELRVPEGMGVIVRTAGAARTKAEVKRDFEYLLRMWETVRETTLRSSAPMLVYEEGSLIKRSIRDLYNKDIDEIVVAGEDGYREAKEFMRLLMPSHAKTVQPYRDPQPMFARYGAETQLDAMFSNHVTLKSGGYIVINQTEALVAIDVNSGRSTREHNIEDTALRTNLEAADEISRQLRLRDLAGLIVIDFIDMEESRNNRTVERRLKEALKNDRARIQIGRMSHFGILEMSRQRMRTGVIEGSTIVCPHCAGAGMVRATSSIALHVLRALEDALIKNSEYDITVKTRTSVALYILNQKRSHLRDLETRFGVSLTIAADSGLANTNYFTLQRGDPAAGLRVAQALEEAPGVAPAGDFLSAASDGPRAGHGLSNDGQLDEVRTGGGEQLESESEAYGRQRRRRRRRRGRGGDREGSTIAANAPQPPDDALEAMAHLGGLRPIAAPASEAPTEPLPSLSGDEIEASRPRARGARTRRGGRGPREARGNVDVAPADTLLLEFAPEPEAPGPSGDMAAGEKGSEAGTRQRGRRSPRARRIAGGGTAASALTADPSFPAAENHDEIQARIVAPEANDAQTSPDSPGGDPRDQLHSAPPDPDSHADHDATRARLENASRSGAENPARPKRSGWWQRARAGWRG